MEITEVKVFPIGEEKLKAFVSVVFDRCFMVNDIKIIQGRDGLFISMPSRKKKNGEFKDVAHPLNNDTRRLIESEILREYERVLQQRGEALPAPHRPCPAAPPEAMPEQRSEGPVAALAAEPVPAQDSPAQDGSEPGRAAEKADEKPSLEEVQEIHLRDSFWSVS